jgi:hemerythrin-like domain-containing protein
VLRDKNLIPLSRQHQHALALCVRIDRALLVGEVALEPWQSEIQLIFQQEVSIHFVAEEKTLFPAAEKFPDLRALVAELREEHEALRLFFSRAAERSLDEEGLRRFGETLSTHIRKEERQLFEGMQERMTAGELATVGAELDRELTAASEACIVPNEATRLRGKA